MPWQPPHPRTTLQLGIDSDWRAWDSLEPVSVEKRRVRLRDAIPQRVLDAGDTIAVPAAKRRNLTKRELAASQGAYTGDDLVWLVPSALLPDGTLLKPGDVVIDDRDSRRWTALEVSQNRLGHTWRLTCRDLVLAFDLRDSIDVERATETTDAAGVRSKRFPPAGGSVLYDGLPARVQPISKEIADERGIRGWKGRYDVVLPYDIDITDEDRITFAGLVLEVRGYRQAETLDTLPTLECEALP